MSSLLAKISFFTIIIYGIFSFHPSSLAAEQPGHRVETTHSIGSMKLASKFIFVAENDPKCEVRYFDLLTEDVVSIVTPASCVEKLIIENDESSVLVVTENRLQVVALSGKPVVKISLPLPEPKVKSGNSKGKLRSATYNPDGSVSVLMGSYYPWDDSDLFLYENIDGNWVMKEEEHCKKWDVCKLYILEQRGNQAYFWGEELNVWSIKQKENP